MKINDVVVGLPEADNAYSVTKAGTVWGVMKIIINTEESTEHLTLRGGQTFVVESQYFRKATIKERKRYLSSPDGAWLNQLIEEKRIQSLIIKVPEKKRELLLPKFEIVHESRNIVAAICEPWTFEFMFYDYENGQRVIRTGKVPFPKFLILIYDRNLYLWFLPKEANKENVLDQYLFFPCIPNCMSEGHICMGKWEGSRRPEKALEDLIRSQWRYDEVGLNWKPVGWGDIKNTTQLLAKYTEINVDEVKWVPTGRTFKGYLKLFGVEDATQES